MIDTFVVVSYTLIPIIATLLGGILASVVRMNQTISSYLQHLVAGIVIAAVSVELIPEILITDTPISTTIGFGLGVLVMILIHFLIHFISDRGIGKMLPLGLIIAGVIDLFIDGILIGVSFIAGEDSGVLIAISLSFCAFFLTATILSRMKSLHNSSISRVVILILVALALPIGAFVGTEVIHLLPTEYFVEVLAFGAAALLFLGIEELLKEAHKVEDTHLTPVLFFIGFWAVLIFKML